MPPAVLRLFRPQGPDRVAVVSVEPSAQGQFLLRLGRGPRLSRLSQGTTYGPYSEADLKTPYQQLVDSLRAEGFLRSGLHALLAGLQSADSAYPTHDEINSLAYPSTWTEAATTDTLGDRRRPSGAQGTKLCWRRPSA